MFLLSDCRAFACGATYGVFADGQTSDAANSTPQPKAEYFY